MKQHIAGMVTLAILSLSIGFSSIAVAETVTSAASGKDQMVVTLPEIVCTSERMQIKQKKDFKEYLNEAVGSIREDLERFQFKKIMEEVKSVLGSGDF
jgi:ribosomal protein S3AE